MEKTLKELEAEIVELSERNTKIFRAVVGIDPVPCVRCYVIECLGKKATFPTCPDCAE